MTRFVTDVNAQPCTRSAGRMHGSGAGANLLATRPQDLDRFIDNNDNNRWVTGQSRELKRQRGACVTMLTDSIPQRG